MLEQIFTKIVTINGVRQTVKVSDPGIRGGYEGHISNGHNVNHKGYTNCRQYSKNIRW